MQKVFTSVRLDAIAFVLGIFILFSGGLAPGCGQIVCQTLRSFGQQGSGNPRGSLIEGNDGALYRTTYGSGSNNLGTVFKLNRDGTGYAVIKYFAGNELQEFSNAGNHMKDKWLFFCGFVTAGLATNLFAAAVPIAGYASPSLSPAVNQALNRMAIWDFHAVDDGTVPVEGDRATINALRNAMLNPGFIRSQSFRFFEIS